MLRDEKTYPLLAAEALADAAPMSRDTSLEPPNTPKVKTPKDVVILLLILSGLPV